MTSNPSNEAPSGAVDAAVFRVAVDAPTSDIYSYSAPPGAEVLVGQMVRVPLRGRQALGYVLEREAESRERSFTIKPIAEVVVAEPLFGPDFYKLIEFVSKYYIYPPGLCVKDILPGGLGPKLNKFFALTDAGLEKAMLDKALLESALPDKQLPEKGEEGATDSFAPLRALLESHPSPTQATKLPRDRPFLAKMAKLVKDGLAEESWRLDYRGSGLRFEWWLSALPEYSGDLPRMGPKEKELLELVRNAPPTPLAHYRNIFANPLAQARNLVKKGLILMESRELFRDDPNRALEARHQRVEELTSDQAAALSEIEAAIEAGERKGFLLFGVTGSGKTEVYLRAAAKALGDGKGVLWLAPEIALTMGLEGRLKDHFPNLPISVLHSGLTPGQRHDHWMSISRGKSMLAIGARSAVFAPVRNLGLVIVDEEHDWAYKQDDGLRYNGRDLAIWRAKESGAALILGTATPSMESFHGTRTGRLRLLRMDSRPGVSIMPEVRILDRRGEAKGGRSAIALELRAAMREAFERGEQALMFINRRGLANLPLCLSCGEVLKCPHCSLALTLHSKGFEPKPASENEDGGADESEAHAPIAKNNRLICHGCGYRAYPSELCPKCHSKLVRYLGVGTESLTRLVEKDFGKKGLKLDTDSAKAKGGLKGILEAFAGREVDFLVGTQMAAKGHDFPFLTLVGVVEADMGMNVADFRASERTFQLLSQVSGRAGRREKPGLVYIQTRNPDHYVMVAARDHNYELFFESEIAIREEMGYPPFSRLALIRLTGGSEALVRECAEKSADMARALIGDASEDELELYGPAPAPLTRLREKYRYQMMLRSKTVVNRHRILVDWIPEARKRLPDGVIMTVDVDPYNLL